MSKTLVIGAAFVDVLMDVPSYQRLVKILVVIYGQIS